MDRTVDRKNTFQVLGVHHEPVAFFNRNLLPILIGASALAVGAAVGKGLWFVGAAIVLVPLVLQYPIQCTLGLYAFLIPFDSIAVLGGGQEGTTLTWFAGAISSASLVAVGMISGRFKAIPTASLWWIALTLWCALTSIWAIDSQTTLKVLPTCFAVVGLYAVSSCFRYTREELRAIMLAAIAGGCVCGIWTVYLFSQGKFFESGSMRASLIVGNRVANPDGIAMTLLVPIALALHNFFSYERWLMKALMLLAIAICGLGLFLTMSRGAVVALVVILLVYFYRTKVRARLAIPFGLLMILLLFLPSDFFVRFQEASHNGGAGRLDIWQAGLEAFTHYGLFGAGLANFPLAYYEHAGAATHFKGLYRDPHNIYLCLAVESGICGLIIFATAVRAQLLAASRSRRSFQEHGLLITTEAAAWGVLAYGFFGTILWEKAFWFSWIMVAAAVATATNVCRQGESETIGNATSHSFGD
jgi:O-antigen ligase